MAIAVPRPCTQPGCPALVLKGRCPQHTTENQRQIDRYRGSRHERNYGTEWERKRERILERDFHLCQVCLVRTASEVDHRIPRALGGSEEDSNLQSICSTCHDEKTGRETGARYRARGAAAHV
jgi:5-methylcytosine-specific restriction enzyme A